MPSENGSGGMVLMTLDNPELQQETLSAGQEPKGVTTKWMFQRFP
jgi:hypothetical protein